MDLPDCNPAEEADQAPGGKRRDGSWRWDGTIQCAILQFGNAF